MSVLHNESIRWHIVGAHQKPVREVGGKFRDSQNLKCSTVGGHCASCYPKIKKLLLEVADRSMVAWALAWCGVCSFLSLLATS